MYALKFADLVLFLSTLSLRRATADRYGMGIIRQISIHALLAESDAAIVSRSSISCQFLSTLSLRRATAVCNQLLFDTLISIHALLAESDCDILSIERCSLKISIHALLAESDTVSPRI